MADASSLATIASIITAFGAAMLFFRIQREEKMRCDHQPIWIPWADRLLILATLTSILFVIVPMLVLRNNESEWALLPPSAATGACILVAGYVPAILAHYRILFAGKRTGPRPHVELPEAVIVAISASVAALASVLTFFLRSCK